MLSRRLAVPAPGGAPSGRGGRPLFCRRRIRFRPVVPRQPALVGACLRWRCCPVRASGRGGPRSTLERSALRCPAIRADPAAPRATRARAVVDIAYVLPFYLEGRSVIRADNHDLPPDDYLPYDYYAAGRNRSTMVFRGDWAADSWRALASERTCLRATPNCTNTRTSCLHSIRRAGWMRASAGGGSESR